MGRTGDAHRHHAEDELLDGGQEVLLSVKGRGERCTRRFEDRSVHPRLRGTPVTFKLHLLGDAFSMLTPGSRAHLVVKL